MLYLQHIVSIRDITTDKENLGMMDVDLHVVVKMLQTITTSVLTGK